MFAFGRAPNSLWHNPRVVVTLQGELLLAKTLNTCDTACVGHAPALNHKSRPEELVLMFAFGRSPNSLWHLHGVVVTLHGELLLAKTLNTCDTACVGHALAFNHKSRPEEQPLMFAFGRSPNSLWNIPRVVVTLHGELLLAKTLNTCDAACVGHALGLNHKSRPEEQPLMFAFGRSPNSLWHIPRVVVTLQGELLLAKTLNTCDTACVGHALALNHKSRPEELVLMFAFGRSPNSLWHNRRVVVTLQGELLLAKTLNTCDTACVGHALALNHKSWPEELLLMLAFG
jgi:hypothetical protein